MTNYFHNESWIKKNNKKDRDAVTVAVDKKFRQDERLGRRVILNNFDPASIVYKMRIPILVVCLAVLYGTCIYAEENINLKESIENEWDYKSSYSNVPLERSLSRHKRSLIQSPFAKLGLRMLGLGDNKIVNDLLEFPNFVNNILNGQLDLCPKRGNTSGNLIAQILLSPIKAMECMVCHIANFIGNQGLAMLRRILPLLSEIIRKILLPGLHTVLNWCADTLPLPPQIVAMIKLFDLMYKVLKIFGYVG